MDKYEYKLKLDQMKSLTAENNYKAAAEIADTINWHKIKNVNALMKAGEIYEKVGRYEESKDILLMAYDRSPIGRMIIYRLAEVAIKMGNYDEAKEYYQEFVEIAPHDNLKYVLRYEIAKAEGADITVLILILEELKELEYSEEWAFELACLYHKAGMSEKCIEACDELILWFGDGPYVERALELKMLYQPLTRQQEEKYRQFRQRKDGIVEVRPGEELESGEIVTEAVQIPKVKLSPERFNTQNLQEELQRSMQQIMEATEKEMVDDSMDTIKKLVEDIPYLQIPKEEIVSEDTMEMPHIETDAEIDNSLKTNFKELLAEDYDGQLSLYMPEKGHIESQITGQLCIDEILAEWEKTKRAAEVALQDAQQRKLESAKARALQEAGDIMERLVDVIPKLDSGLTPKDLLEEQYLGGQPIADDKAAEMVANMNQILQQEIDRLSTENAMMDEQLAAVEAGLMAEAQMATYEEPVLELESYEEPMSEIDAYDQSMPEMAAYEEPMPEMAAYEEPMPEMAEEPMPEMADLLAAQLEAELAGAMAGSMAESQPEIGFMAEEPVPEMAAYEEPVPEMAEEPMPEMAAYEEPMPEMVAYEEPMAEESVPEMADLLAAQLEAELAGNVAGNSQAEEAVSKMATKEMPEMADLLAAQLEAELAGSVAESKMAEVTEEVLPEIAMPDEVIADVKNAKKKKASEVLPKIAEPDEDEQHVISKLSKEQREIFTYFVPIKGMEKQLCQAMTGAARRLSSGGTAATGNMIIQGGQGSGKTVLATSMIKALQKETGKPNGRIGKIEASVLNQKDVEVLLKKVAGGCLIIEKVGGLSKDTAIKLSKALEKDESGIFVIIEDTHKGIDKALGRDAGFAARFSEKINIPIFTSDELVSFAKSYANELGYTIDEMGVLALYNSISNIQKLDRATTLTEVKEIVDDAIARAERGGLKKAFSIITSRRYDEDDYIILHEKDFGF